MHNRPELRQTMRTPTSPSNEGKNKAEGEYLSHVWFLSWEKENRKKDRSKRKELQSQGTIIFKIVIATHQEERQKWNQNWKIKQSNYQQTQ